MNVQGTVESQPNRVSTDDMPGTVKPLDVHNPFRPPSTCEAGPAYHPHFTERETEAPAAQTS